MNTVMVTGSDGYIGRRLISYLRSLEINVHGLDVDYFEFANWEDELTRILGEVNPATIFHVGACSDTLETDVNFMMKTNYQSTKIMVDWSKINNRKLIYSSSAANYGINKRYPSNLYGWSKYAAENYVISNGGIALRYFNVYGPGEENKGKMSSLVYQSYLKILNGEDVYLFPGNPTRDFIYVEDVLTANYLSALDFEENKGKYFEVSTGVSSSFEECLEIFGIDFQYVSESAIPVGYQFFTKGDPNRWLPSWKPNYSLKDGLLHYRKYLRAAGNGD